MQPITKFWIVIVAPGCRHDGRIAKGENNMYFLEQEAVCRAKEVAAKTGKKMLVLEVVSAWGPSQPPVERIPLIQEPEPCC